MVLLKVSQLIDLDLLVEIEADADVPDAASSAE